MNRNIKFRYYSELYDYDTGDRNGYYKMIYSDEYSFDNLRKFFDLFVDDENIIMEFTGMIDKNGKEIYEGDIVKTYIYDGWFDVCEAKTCNYEIKWSNFDYGWRGFTKRMNTTKFAGVTFNLTETEIVGNIFENKELRSTTPTLKG